MDKYEHPVTCRNYDRWTYLLTKLGRQQVSDANLVCKSFKTQHSASRSERENCSRHQKNEDFRGDIDVTISGLTCQRWDSQVPHSHRGYKPEE